MLDQDQASLSKVGSRLGPFLPFLELRQVFTHPASPELIGEVLYLTPSSAVHVLLDEGANACIARRAQQQQVVWRQRLWVGGVI